MFKILRQACHHEVYIVHLRIILQVVVLCEQLESIRVFIFQIKLGLKLDSVMELIRSASSKGPGMSLKRCSCQYIKHLQTGTPSISITIQVVQKIHQDLIFTLEEVGVHTCTAKGCLQFSEVGGRAVVDLVPIAMYAMTMLPSDLAKGRNQRLVFEEHHGGFTFIDNYEVRSIR